MDDEVEVWSWYAITIVFITTRLISRVLFLGSWKKLQTDDWLMVWIVVPFTTLAATKHPVDTFETNYLLPEELPLLTPDSISRRVHGSKVVLLFDQSMILTIWTVKICMLLLVYRFTSNLPYGLAVKATAAYVVLGLVIIEILFFAAWCRPFSDYWAVPTDNFQCMTSYNHIITTTVFNISSDLMILAITLSLFIKSHLPFNQKIFLCLLFGLGIFTIISAILSRVAIFSEHAEMAWSIWYIREGATAIIVANVPLLYSLIQRVFRLDPASVGMASGPDLPISEVYSDPSSIAVTASR